MTSADMLSILVRIENRNARISALVNNPHWISDRRWTIAELAQGNTEDLALLVSLVAKGK